MYFCGYYVLSNDPNSEEFSIISIFGVFFVKIWVFDPPGCPFIGFPEGYAIDIKDIALRFSLNVFLWFLCVI